MKKFISGLVVLAALVAFAAPEHKAEAQVVYSYSCCDSAGNVRCLLNNGPFPIGNTCFCYGQGYGVVC